MCSYLFFHFPSDSDLFLIVFAVIVCVWKLRVQMEGSEAEGRGFIKVNDTILIRIAAHWGLRNLCH